MPLPGALAKVHMPSRSKPLWVLVNMAGVTNGTCKTAASAGLGSLAPRQNMTVQPISAPSRMNAINLAERGSEYSPTSVSKTSGTTKNSVASAKPHRQPAHRTHGRSYQTIGGGGI